MKFAKRVTITSALPYINGIKHLGNLAGSILPADVFHRFLDLLGVDNIFICGTDDHGTATEIAASAEGLGLEEYTNKYYKLQKENYEKWNFDFTYFGRTHTKEHEKLTQSFFLNLKKNGYILEQEVTLPFCKKCKKYLSDRFIKGTCPKCGKDARGDQCENCGKLLDPIELVDPQCALCKSKEIEFKKENHLFLDFAKLQPKLEDWLATKKDWPTNTVNFAKAWLKQGLRPRDITRNLKWGVPVPGRSDLVFYVWFDAPMGYISITEVGLKDNWQEWWNKEYVDKGELQVIHFLGKDNIPFHTIFWPGTLIGDQRFALPSYVQGYEYLNWEGGKFSTSKHRGIFADKALELYSADYWRFYLCRVLPENKDSSFEWKDFQEKINSELNDNYGNLFYRVTSFIEKNFNGTIPHPSVTDVDEKMFNSLNKRVKKTKQLIEEIKLKEALSEIMSLSSELNTYVQDNAPWKLLKSKNEKDKQRAATVLYVAANVLRSITVLLSPYIPVSAEKALDLLGSKDKKWDSIDKQLLKPGHKIKSEILFKKIEDKEIEKHQSQRVEPEIHVAEILEAKDHPNADNLVILKIDLGPLGKRQIVAGIKDAYSADQLKGKHIAVVVNLEPAVLRGEKSNGMLLATEQGILVIPIQSKVEPGTIISGNVDSPKIKYNDFKKHELVVRDSFVHIDGTKLELKMDKSVANGTRVV